MGDLGDQWGKAGQGGMLGAEEGEAGEGRSWREEGGREGEVVRGRTRRLGIGQSLKLQHLSSILIIHLSLTSPSLIKIQRLTRKLVAKKNSG